MSDIKTEIIILSAIMLTVSGCNHSDNQQEPVKVTLSAVIAPDEGSVSYYSGTIEAQKSIPLSFQTLGTITEVAVREGQHVRKGELLASLDCQNNETALRMAEAKSKQAEDAYRRFEPMYKNGNLAEIKMVEIETGKTEAEQALKLAQKGASDCRLTAPTSGIISRRDAEPGSAVLPGKPVLRLESLDQVYASISVPESEISTIKPGGRAEVEIAALNVIDAQERLSLNYRDGMTSSTNRLKGIVSDSGVSADPLSRTYSVRVLLDNPGRRILPGMLCNVSLRTADKRRVPLLLVPATAINIDETDRKYLYVVDPEEKIARKRLIETEGFAMGAILVSRGLSAGDYVISEGAQKLSDGTPVRVN